MHRLLELQSGQPASMDQCPGWPVVVMAVAQQESAQLLTGLTQAAHRRQTRTQEIADSLMGRIWNPDRGQLTGPVQLGELVASRRSVLIRSPGLRGISEGATTTHPCPAAASCRWIL